MKRAEVAHEALMTFCSVRATDVMAYYEDCGKSELIPLDISMRHGKEDMWFSEFPSSRLLEPTNFC